MKTIIIIFIGGVFLGALLKFLEIEASAQPIQFIILLTFAELYGIAIWESTK